ncbi:hypothetical protein [uncultured Dubosiella sp.]|uniref:hypothetical protein n=1 Tax=uncultured Dubosiella sp. TaxID=1937011 RepID=UPI0032B236D9
MKMQVFAHKRAFAAPDFQNVDPHKFGDRLSDGAPADMKHLRQFVFVWDLVSFLPVLLNHKVNNF